MLGKLCVLGFLGYTIAQGFQCLGLYYLPAVSVTFILNFTPLTVLLLGAVFLREYPSLKQLIGVVIVLVGAYLYFNDPLGDIGLTGVLVTLASGIGWASYLVASRLLSIKVSVRPLPLTAISVGFGTLLMLTMSSYEGFRSVPLSGWVIILWLGVVNTALAFFLWNRALLALEAFQISVLQNTMLVQIGLLAWLFLGEGLTAMKLISMLLVFAGALIVQLRDVSIRRR